MKIDFDEIICAPRRLGILATLVPGESLTFTEMKTMTGLSDGNLHVQSRKLADAGYIEISKTKKGRRSVTHFSMTDLGRKRLREHVGRLQNILKTDNRVGNPAGKRATEPERKPKSVARKRPARRDDSAVWA
jgi:DNA-binding MarR family transcriptional regulator